VEKQRKNRRKVEIFVEQKQKKVLKFRLNNFETAAEIAANFNFCQNSTTKFGGMWIFVDPKVKTG